MSVPRAVDPVLEVDDRIVTLERFTEVYALRQFELEAELAAASRGGREGDVRSLQARQRVLPFDTIEWLIDTLLMAGAAGELGLEADARRVRRFAARRLGALEHLVSGKPLARCYGGPGAAAEEVRLMLCLPPAEFLEIVRWLCLREQGQRVLGPPSGRRAWLAARRRQRRIVRSFDSHAYDWVVDRLLPVRAAWWARAGEEGRCRDAA
jgi:hypothetical protein